MQLKMEEDVFVEDWSPMKLHYTSVARWTDAMSV
jgi:hypothetical protein